MKLILERYEFYPNTTIGRLYVNGKLLCRSMEDKDRKLDSTMSLSEIVRRKIYGRTAIPYGTYKVDITYSPKFKRMMPIILGVPGYAGIRFHQGVTHKNTLGCPLVGMENYGERLIRTNEAYRKFFKLLYGAKLKGEPISILVSSYERLSNILP